MSTKASAAEWLFGQTRARLLSVLLANPEETFYLRQLARQLESSAGSVARELKRLTQQEWISCRRDGNQMRYAANRQHPAYPELRGLLAKTSGMIQGVRDSLSGMKGDIDFAFIYGSVARGTDKASSDVDVAIIGHVSLARIISTFDGLESAYGRTVNPVVYSREEFAAKVSTAKHFPQTLLKGEKIMLIGDQDELRRLGQIRLGGARIK